MFLNGRAILTPGPARRGDLRRLVRAAVQRPRRGPGVQAPAPADGRPLGARAGDRRPGARARKRRLRCAGADQRDRALDHDPQTSGLNGTPYRATYRLQLNSSFRFADARALIPYLRDLGISHLYLSPSLQARPGSTHGYDVVDPTRVSDDLGGERRAARAGHRHPRRGSGNRSRSRSQPHGGRRPQPVLDRPRFA